MVLGWREDFNREEENKDTRDQREELQEEEGRFAAARASCCWESGGKEIKESRNPSVEGFGKHQTRNDK